MKQVQTKVINNIRILPELKRNHGKSSRETRLIWLAAPEIAQEARPGQFVMVKCGADSTLPRPFSIFRIYSKSDLALFYTVWEDGKGTDWLAERRVGDIVEIFGPLGSGFSIQRTSRNLLLIAGGMGLAPLFFLAQEALSRMCSVTLLYGTAVRNRYPIPPEIKTVPATDDGSVGYKGLVTDLIPQYINGIDQIFACGPMSMYMNMMERSKSLGIEGKPTQVSLEVRMACGVGVCFGCTIRTKQGLKQVCKDGPVFDINDIIWDSVVL
ncbi:MAG: dihydroorotate dehydrogenase electron transfer subunit [Dehalococcoidales bacterium]|nr:dihydroorotate dehydrogenase electron transfer subunit [Dehalococcoidales bacterium]